MDPFYKEISEKECQKDLDIFEVLMEMSTVEISEKDCIMVMECMLMAMEINILEDLQMVKEKGEANICL